MAQGTDREPGNKQGVTGRDFEDNVVIPVAGDFVNRVGAWGKKHRKGLIRGTLAGGLASLIIAGFFAILPLKLIHFKELFFRHNFAVQEMDERIMGNKLMRRIIFSRGVNGDGSYKIKGKGFIRDRITNYNLKRFEDKMRKKGIDFEYDPTGARGLIAIHELDAAGNRTGKTIPISELDDAGRTNALFNAIDEAIPHWRIGKRIKYRLLMTHRTGVRWKFFRNAGESTDGDDRNFIKRLDDYIRGRDTDTNRLRMRGQDKDQAGNPDPNTNDNNAGSSQINDIAGKVENDVFSGTAPNIDEAVSKYRGDFFGRGIGVSGLVASVCGMQKALGGVSEGVTVARTANLMRTGNLLPVNASHLKDGRAAPGDINNFMRRFDSNEPHYNKSTKKTEMRYAGAETSAAYKAASGQALTAEDRRERDLSPDAHPSRSAVTGIAGTFDSVMSTIPGANLTCSVATNAVGQLFLIGGELALAFFSGGSTAVAGTVAAEGAQEALARTVLPQFIKYITNLSVSGAVNAIDLTNNMDAGLNLSANTLAHNLGGRDLSRSEFKSRYEVASKVAASEFSRQSLAYRWLNPEDPQSLISRLALKAPASPTVAVARLAGLPSYLGRSFAGLFLGLRPALAEEVGNVPRYGVENRYDFKQYGHTDEELNRYDPVDNEAYLIDQPSFAAGISAPECEVVDEHKGRTRYEVLQGGYDYYTKTGGVCSRDARKHRLGYGEACYDIEYLGSTETDTPRPKADGLSTDASDICGSLGKSSDWYRDKPEGSDYIDRITDAEVMSYLYCPGGNCSRVSVQDEILRLGTYRLARHSICNIETESTDAEPSEGCPRFGSGATTAPTTSTTGLPTGTTQELARQILANNNITFSGNARSTMDLLASGATTVPAGNGSQVSVKPEMLAVILKMGQDGVKIVVSSITTGRHTTTSNHYAGKAFDIGNEQNAAQIMKHLYDNRVAYNLDELFYDSPPAGTSNLNNGLPSGPIGGHSNHIHVAVK